MISEEEYVQLDAVAQAEMVRRGDATASEFLEAAIARAEKVNPRLNAIVIPMYEIARARARGTLAGPLAGVPFLLKDLFQDYAGVLATSGSRGLRRVRATPDRHSEIVVRHLAAGLVIFGRTNTPEFGAKGITEPDAWGPTRNPWNLDLSPGGSSGGAAAAVSAGIVPAAAASDGGGSIRIPSASTGLFGLKPGRGRTPTGPGMGEAIHGAAMNHVITRSVRDSAHLLDATHGPEIGSLCHLAPPERPYSAALERDPKPLRVAWTTRSPIGTAVDPNAITAVARTARLLEELGHRVEPAEPEIDGNMLARDFLRIWFTNLAHHLEATRLQWPVHAHEFELDSLAVEAVGRARSARDYVDSYVRWSGYGYQLSQFFQRFDVYMTPATAEPPPRIGQLATPRSEAMLLRAVLSLGLSRVIGLLEGTVEQIAYANLRGVPFTQLANVTGVPAMSVPLHTYPNGLPLGIQFLTEHGGEGLLFSLAAQLERAAPWSARRPQL